MDGVSGLAGLKADGAGREEGLVTLGLAVVGVDIGPCAAVFGAAVERTVGDFGARGDTATLDLGSPFEAGPGVVVVDILAIGRSATDFNFAPSTVVAFAPAVLEVPSPAAFSSPFGDRAATFAPTPAPLTAALPPR